MRLSVQPICFQVLADRYAAPGESLAAQVYARVAHALAQAEPLDSAREIARLFRRNPENGAIGAGRIMNAGTAAHATMVNCRAAGGGGRPARRSPKGSRRPARRWRWAGAWGTTSSPPVAADTDASSAAPAVRQAIDRYEEACANLRSAGSPRGADGRPPCSHPDILELRAPGVAGAGARSMFRWW